MKKITLWIVSLGFIALVAVTTGCNTFNKRQPADIQKHKHYVMTLHGVRGNEQSFGDFHYLAKKHLEMVDPGYEVIPVNMTYSVGLKDYTPEKAALEINQKLEKIIPAMHDKDKISVVGYSMGGQVGLAWYYLSLKDPKYKMYPEHTDKFISLGAAYWGAQEAGLVTGDIEVLKATLKASITEINKMSQNLITLNIWKSTQEKINEKFIFPQIDKLKSVDEIGRFYDKYILPAAKISFAEVKALSWGGTIPTNLRLFTTNNPNSTKWVSISTLVQCFETDLGATTAGCDDFQNKFFEFLNTSINAKYTFGYTRRETDNAVLTPLSNAQFLYATDSNPDYAINALTPAASFRYAINPSNHRIYFAETLHATVITASMYDKVLPLLGKLGDSWKRLASDMVLVYKKDCEEVNQCHHPVYKYIVNEMANCDRADSTCDSQQVKNVIGTLLQNTDQDEKDQNALQSELHGFVVDLNLRVPKGYNLSEIDSTNIQNYIQFDKETDANGNKFLRTNEKRPYTVRVARDSELASILTRKVTEYSNQEQLKVSFTGIIVPNKNEAYDYKSLAQTGAKVPFTINLPGLKPRKVEALVRPYHSTFVDLVIAK